MRYWTLALLALAAAPAEAKWREASTSHFVIYSEQSAKELQEFATKLERYDKAMRVVRRLPDPALGPANRLTVYVVDNLSDVRRLYGAGSSSGIAGFYIGRAGSSIAVMPRSSDAISKHDLNPQTVLMHEYAHHFMRQNFPGGYPMWFSEGFAEFNATAKFEKDGSVHMGAPANHRAIGLVGGYPLTMAAMLGMGTERIGGEKLEAVYGRGWLLTHFLTFEPSRKGQLAEYLIRINKGENSSDAAKAVFGDLGKLDRDVNKYMAQDARFLPLPPQLVQVGDIQVRELTPAEQAVMEVKIRSRRGVTTAQAKALLPKARNAAAPFPNEEAAQTTLAEAEFDAGNYADAQAAADRALTANPRSVAGLIYKGRAKMELAKAAKAKDEATWNDVRQSFLAANKIDPLHPEPLMHYYNSFEGQGVAPSANAVLGLVQALDLAPQDGDLRLRVAWQHLVDGKAAEARAALAPIAFDPHGGRAAQLAADLVEKLDQGHVEEALKSWQKANEKEAQSES